MSRLTKAKFERLVKLLGSQAQEDIAWAENICPPATAAEFAREVIYVICNSGMKNTVARGIYNRAMDALKSGQPVSTVFGHAGKAAAIEQVWANRERLHNDFLNAADQLKFCASLPYVGKITMYHVAKNFGVDCAKPDVHLARLAALEGATAEGLCRRLAKETGYRVATVDTILWRACVTGVLNSRTGEIRR